MLAMVVQIATLCGVLAAIWQLAESNRQRYRDFESLFVQRYWSIVDHLSVDALAGIRPDDGAVSDGDRRAVLAYLRLSEDEIELWQRRWISAAAWREWSEGIHRTLHRWPFDAVWEETSAREAERGAEGEFECLRRCCPPGATTPTWPERASRLARRP